MKDPVRIANCSGFYGDRLSAAKEMVEDGPIDVLTGDWLAELTMLILAKTRTKQKEAGYARTFVQQMQQVAATCVEKSIKVVTNAGGLNPRGCADAVQAILDEQGIKARVAWIDGDDLMTRLPELKATGNRFEHMDTGEALGEQDMLTANAYIGGWGITEALNRGADIVITGRTTDAAIVSGAAAWYHGWKPGDYDQLAGAIVAGHVIECGCQATGGNYSFFKEVPGLEYPGFPIAEIADDGSSVITKHESHGGQVSVGTVTSQLLYEIGAPEYKNPDVISRFDTIELEEIAPNRVLISGVRGEPGPDTLKVSMNYNGGWRTVSSMALTGLDIQEKANLYERALWAQFPEGKDSFDEVKVELIPGVSDPRNNEEHVHELRIVVKSSDPKLAGKAFFRAAIELGLANYPGTCVLPGSSQAFGVCWPTLIPAKLVTQRLHMGDEVIEISCVPCKDPAKPVKSRSGPSLSVPGGPSRRAPLGLVYGARSGDKAGSANVGIFARSDEAWAWLEKNLTIEKLQELMPEAREHTVNRYLLPSIRSLNFVFQGLLGEGVAATTRLDSQAKGLGEYLRALEVDLPESLLS
ncbi:MAG: DUF1446 domain-containing protein [Porticoccaceae bacterium]|nr:DUF1446 domain-containing protein [Porticoccaceae bacterium]